MNKVRWVGVSLIISLALAVLFFGGLGRHALWQPAVAESASLKASPAEAELAQTAAYSSYIPLISHVYDPSYSYPFGVTMYRGVREEAGLSTVTDAGAYWLTTMLYWSAVEPEPGAYNWANFDASIQAAQAAGAELFVLFTGNPTWAAALPGGPVTDTQDLVSFVTLMAERYDGDGSDDAPGSPVIRYWSFYAEPDNSDLVRALGGKGYFGHTPGLYASMLSSVAPAIHNANPQAKVLIGGLAYDYFVEDGGPFVRTFLTDTLVALNSYPGGATAYLDEIAFHYYPVAIDRWPTMRAKALDVRGIMERNGVGSLPLISPEMGYWSSDKWGSSLENQAKRLVQMYTHALSVGMMQLSWYMVQDTAVAGTAEDVAPDRTCGLLDINGVPKPAYAAYSTMTSELRGARYLRTLSQPDIEGYAFRMLNGREKTVVWATRIDPGNGYTTVIFPYTCLRRVEIYGAVYSPIVDGDTNWDYDGLINGRISLALHEAGRPIYVAPCP